MRTSTLLMILFILVLAGPMLAASDTWSGTVDTDWNTAGNWAGSSVPSASTDIATFSGAATANQPVLSSSLYIEQVRFESAGWTLTGGDYNITFAKGDSMMIHSSGAGVNTFDSTFTDFYGGATLQADTGNTLILNKDYTAQSNYTVTGDGTIVFNGNAGGSTRTWYFNAGTTLLNGSAVHNVGSGSTVYNGKTLGGTMPGLNVVQYQTLALEDGALLSPGGNGTYGDLISTMTLGSSSATIRAFVDMGGSSSQLIMDIGGSVGSNDQIVVDLIDDAIGGKFYLQNSILALRTEGVVQDGTYTLITETTGDYDGTFGSVTLNGETLDAARYTLNYNADSVTIDLNGIVPEPTTLGLLGLGGLILLRRRKR